MDADAAIRIFPRRARAAFVTLGLDRSGPSAATVEISVNGAPASRVELAHGVRTRVEVALPAAKAVEIAFRSTGSPLQLFTVELAGR
jgi:hypothetical protein